MEVSLLIRNTDGTHLVRAEWSGVEEAPAFRAEALGGSVLTKRYFRRIGLDRTRPGDDRPLYQEVSLPAYRKARAAAAPAA